FRSDVVASLQFVHTALHADHLVAVVSPPIIDPAGVITVKALLVARRKHGAPAVPSLPVTFAAMRGDAPIRDIPWNSVLGLHVVHAPFHAAYLVAIILLLVLHPAGVIAVKALLVARRKPPSVASILGQSRKHHGQSKNQYSKRSFPHSHYAPRSRLRTTRRNIELLSRCQGDDTRLVCWRPVESQVPCITIGLGDGNSDGAPRKSNKRNPRCAPAAQSFVHLVATPASANRVAARAAFIGKSSVRIRRRFTAGAAKATLRRRRLRLGLPGEHYQRNRRLARSLAGTPALSLPTKRTRVVPRNSLDVVSGRRN